MNKIKLLLTFLGIYSISTHAAMLMVKSQKTKSKIYPKAKFTPHYNIDSSCKSAVIFLPHKNYIEPSLPVLLEQKIVSVFSLCSISLSLKDAAKIVNALPLVNKLCNANVNNDEKIILQLIKQLSDKFECTNQQVAKMLCTKASTQIWTRQKAFFYGASCFGQDFTVHESNRLKALGLDLEFTYDTKPSTLLLNTIRQCTWADDSRKRYDVVAAWLIGSGAYIHNIIAEKFSCTQGPQEIPAKQNAFSLALRYFYKLSIAALLQHPELDVNHTDENEDTPLHCALYGLTCHYHDLRYCKSFCKQVVWTRASFVCRVVKKLLQKGADPTVINKDGKTPLMLAQEIGNQLLVSILKEAVADWNFQKKNR